MSDPFNNIFGAERGLTLNMNREKLTWQDLAEIKKQVTKVFSVTFSDGEDFGDGPNTTTFCFSMSDQNRHKGNWFELNIQPILDKARSTGMRVEESLEEKILPRSEARQGYYICSIGLPVSPLVWITSRTGRTRSPRLSDNASAALSKAAKS